MLPVIYAFVENRSNNKKNLISLKRPNTNVLFILIVCGGLLSILLGTASTVNAQTQPIDSLQTITLEQAKELAVQNFPKIQAARLEIENQEVQKKTAWDLGSTSIFTGAEKIGYTPETTYMNVGIKQSNINIFGIVPKLELQKERVALAEKALNLLSLIHI